MAARSESDPGSYLPCRLGKFVKDRSTLSVVDVRCAWAEGRVRLVTTARNGDADGLDSFVFAEDTVLLDGVELQPKQEHFCAILNKPRATISTARDPRGKGDLRPWLAQMPAGAFAVGRLDRDTTGLLLFTTDGNLANAVLRPEHHTEKLYWLWLNESFTHDDPRLAALTVRTDPRYDGADGVEVLRRTDDYVELALTLKRGKHRQIRRMCRALDLRLLHLHRKRIGPLCDTSLALGHFRELSAAEVQSLWRATGGMATLRQRKLRALERTARKHRDAGRAHERLERWLRELPEAGSID